MVSVPVWVPTVTSALITVTMLASVMVFLRYAEDLTRWSGRRELEIRRLIRRYGASDSLAYFATRRDKASVFSPDGEAVITYRVSFGVSAAGSDRQAGIVARRDQCLEGGRNTLRLDPRRSRGLHGRSAPLCATRTPRHGPG